MDNNNFGRDQFNIYDPTGKIAIGGSDAQREITVSGIGSIPPNFQDYWVDRATYQTTLTDRINSNPVTEIVASGGFGKSSLAAWAHENLSSGFKKRIWVSFGRAKSFDRFARWVLQEIGFPNKDPKADEGTLLRELLYRLNDPNTPVKTLVVMDQLESIDKADDWQWFKEFLEKWSAEGKVSRVLVTTRSRILTQESIDLGGMNVAEGTVFFEREGLTGDRFPDLIDLAGGHPLLLKLAATWTKATYGARVDDRAIDFFGKLFANYRGDPTAGVEAIFGVIFEALPIGLQELLCGVSVYRLPFGVAMAQAMQPQVQAQQTSAQRDLGINLFGIFWEVTKTSLISLTEKGLLLGQGEAFTLHPLVSELVRSRVTEEARVAGHEGAIGYYSANFREWDGTIESCHGELESFYHACELGQYHLAYKVLDQCDHLLDLASQWRSLLLLYQRLTDVWRIVDLDYAEAENLGWAWIRLGNLQQKLGEVKLAIASYQEAQTIFSQLDVQIGKAAAVGSLGIVYRSLGQYQWAIECHQTSLNIAREIGNRNSEGGTLCNIGRVYESLSDYTQAIDYYQQALPIQREVGNRQFEANSLSNLGSAYQSLGQYQHGLDYNRQALKIRRQIGDLSGESESLFQIGYALGKLDKHAQALLNFQQAKAIYEDLELDHKVKQCQEAINNINQIIAPQHQTPPTLDSPKAKPQDDWWERNLPANERKTAATRQSSGNFWWLFAAGFALAILIYWLRR